MTNNNVNRKIFAAAAFFLGSTSLLINVLEAPVGVAMWIMAIVASVFWLYFSLFANDRD